LRSLAAHASQVSYLAKYSPSSFKNLSELRVGTGLMDFIADSRYITNMSTHLLEIGPLPAMKKLVYIHGDSLYRKVDLFHAFMVGFSGVFPKLDTWEGRLSDNLTVVSTLHLF